MTKVEKLAAIKTVLGFDDTSYDATINTYIDMAGSEIIGWRYSYSPNFSDVVDVPTEYEMTQVHAVVAGFSIRGAEGQSLHEENSIRRTFKYEDMVAYIRAHVIPIAGVI